MTFSGAEPTKLNPLCYVLISAPENVTAPANVTILRRPSTLKSISQPETNGLALKWLEQATLVIVLELDILGFA